MNNTDPFQDYKEYKDLQNIFYMLYFKNVSNTWSLNRRVFITKEMAEYIASFYDRETYIIPVITQKPILVEHKIRKEIKVRKIRMPKSIPKTIKVRKVKVPKCQQLQLLQKE